MKTNIDNDINDGGLNKRLLQLIRLMAAELSQSQPPHICVEPPQKNCRGCYIESLLQSCRELDS